MKRAKVAAAMMLVLAAPGVVEGQGPVGSSSATVSLPVSSNLADAGPVDVGLVDEGPVDAGVVDAGVVRRPRPTRRDAPPLAGEPPWDESIWVGPYRQWRGRDPKARRRLRARRRRMAARRDAGVAPESPDAGVVSIAQTVPPAPPDKSASESTAPSSPPRFENLAAELDDAFWTVVRTVFGAFLILRFLAWWVRREARRGQSWAEGPARVWVFVEVLAWALVVVWVSTHVFPERSALAAGVGVVVVTTVLATSWTALRDIVAGLILAAERPFDVGDFVQVADVEGQVLAFRARVLELTTSTNEHVRVPYRRIAGTTRVKGGGTHAAHAVHLSFDLPEGLTPQEALRTVRELAASSPWAVLGVRPQVDVSHEGASQRIVLEAYAFSGAARAELSCDLDAGWKAFLRRTEKRSSTTPRENRS